MKSNQISVTMHYRARKQPVTRVVDIKAELPNCPTPIELRTAFLAALRPAIKNGDELNWRAIRIGVRDTTTTNIGQFVFNGIDNKLALATFAYRTMGMIIAPHEEREFVAELDDAQTA